MKLAQTLSLGVATAVLVAAGACGTTVVDHTNSGGAGGGSGASSPTSTEDGSGAGDPCFPDSCSGPSSSSTGAGGAAVCGGLAGIVCPEHFYCAFANGMCGGDDSEGACKPMPTGCDKHLEPVCGCDGKLYDNPCDATEGGVDTSSSKSCMFTCGSAICEHQTQYCQITTAGPMNTDYACLPVPDTCNGEPSCSCVGCSECQQSPSGDVTVTCVGD